MMNIMSTKVADSQRPVQLSDGLGEVCCSWPRTIEVNSNI